VQLPFPEQTIGLVEFIPKHFVNSQLFPEYCGLQLHCSTPIQIPLFEQFCKHNDVSQFNPINPEEHLHKSISVQLPFPEHTFVSFENLP
jgi:hypothetical protein